MLKEVTRINIEDRFLGRDKVLINTDEIESAVTDSVMGVVDYVTKITFKSGNNMWVEGRPQNLIEQPVRRQLPPQL